MLFLEYFADIRFALVMIFFKKDNFLVGVSLEWAGRHLLKKCLNYILANVADDMYE